VQSIEQYSLNTSFLHFDTTSLSFFGAYEREDFGSITPEMPPAPRVTYGYSKDNRPDLKQILFGTLVTADGGVPLAGHALDGNHSDNESAAEFFAEVRQLVADPRTVCCVADSKGWCGRVLGVIKDHGMRLLSRLPRSHSLHQDLMAMPWMPTGKITIPGSGKEPTEELEWMVFDRIDAFERELPPESPEGKARIERFSLPIRALRVRSTALLRTKVKTAQRERARERAKAKRLIASAQNEAYACERDALHAIALLCERNVFRTMELAATAVRQDGPVKPKRGRPRKQPRPAVTGDHHYRLAVTTSDLDEATMAARMQDEAGYILIRTRNEGWDIADAEMIQRYKGQYHNEHGFAWLKSGMRLNPLFLKTPTRIGSLCFVYCLGLMIWNLIQRNVRQHLVATKTGLPYHRRKLSDRITTRFFLELFPQVQVIPVTLPDGSSQKKLAGFDDIVAKACQAVGASSLAFSPL
jgi:transposase